MCVFLAARLDRHYLPPGERDSGGFSRSCTNPRTLSHLKRRGMRWDDRAKVLHCRSRRHGQHFTPWRLTSTTECRRWLCGGRPADSHNNATTYSLQGDRLAWPSWRFGEIGPRGQLRDIILVPQSHLTRRTPTTLRILASWGLTLAGRCTMEGSQRRYASTAPIPLRLRNLRLSLGRGPECCAAREVIHSGQSMTGLRSGDVRQLTGCELQRGRRY